VSSSDLELARALSRLLAEPPSTAPPPSGPAAAAPVEPPDPARFVRLRRPEAGEVSAPGGAAGTRS
jgi:hypothetical protein